ncbi:MAG: hypothetical protein ACXAB7_09980 [Candidatus Kariarchaeaceae archaeon]|jgi:hypothetical protein
MNDDIDFSMFEPTGRDMRKDFPELKNYPEFEDLKSREIRFCWYMGNKTSPLVTKKMKGEALVKSAIELCYDERAKEHNPTVISMLSGDIPQDILSGISRMASFSPSYRLRAKWMNEYVFDKLNSLIIVDAMAEAEMKSDADAKKKYADLAIKISSEMPELVQRMESGYGVKLVKKNTKSGEPLTKLSELTDRIK